MMKKIVYIFVLVWISYACDSYLDVNKDPNYPSEAPNSLVIPSAQNFITAKLGETIFNYGGFFAQYWDQAVEANQYNDLAEYNILQSFFDRPYRDLYAGALSDLQVVKKQAEEEKLWGDYLVATVLRAYVYQILVDMMDQAPFSEALKGSEIPMPKWDNGKEIYAQLITEIDEALAKGVTENSAISADMWLGSDATEWIAFANAMKFKLLMRSSYVEDNNAKIMELINSGSIYFSQDIKMDVYTDEATKRNPWFECNLSGSGLSTVNNIASLPIISYLKVTNDPRISSLFDKSINGSLYKGLVPGSKTQVVGAKTKDYSYPKVTATTPVYLFTLAELNFLVAEAQLRFGSDAAAKTAYEAAVQANFALHGVDGAAAFLATDDIAWDKATSTEGKMELIGMQKWVALCMVNHGEAWTEIRRLDIPKFSARTAQEIIANETVYSAGELIVPMVNYIENSGVVKRVPFPEIAVNLNNNTPAQKGVTTPVWWDNK